MSTSPRPEGSAILGVSMPLALKQRIKRLADLDKRTMAQWAALHLEQIVADLEATQPAPSQHPASTQPAPSNRNAGRSRLKVLKANDLGGR